MNDRMTLESVRPDIKQIKGPKFVVLWRDGSGNAIEVAHYYTIDLAREHIRERLENFRGRFRPDHYAIAEVSYRVLE